MITKEKLAKVIEENKKYLLRLACSITANEYDAQDAVGEAIIKLFENADKIREPDKIKSWLCTVVVNEAKNIVYKRKRENNGQFLGELSEIYEEESRRIEKIYLWQVVESLTVEQRELIFLYYIENNTVKEINKLIGTPTGTIKSRLAQLRKVLFKMLREGDEE